jgi:hypothetical protein
MSSVHGGGAAEYLAAKGLPPIEGELSLRQQIPFNQFFRDKHALELQNYQEQMTREVALEAKQAKAIAQIQLELSKLEAVGFTKRDKEVYVLLDELHGIETSLRIGQSTITGNITGQISYYSKMLAASEASLSKLKYRADIAAGRKPKAPVTKL